MSASGARRLGIRSGGRSVAIGSATRRCIRAASARTFTVRIARSVRRALSRAKGADLTLEVTVSGAEHRLAPRHPPRDARLAGARA